jgi:hypothetical protein
MTNKALATALAAALAVLPVAGPLAQTPPAKPAGITVQSGEPKATKTAAASGKKMPARMNEDARHCLDFPTIAEIVKCAEPYRY